MRREGRGEKQRLIFRTNVDDLVTAGAEHPLGFQPGSLGGFAPFIVVREGLKARIARSVYYELAALAMECGASSELGVWSGGVFFPFPAPEPSV
jgi:hypothetical protein